MEEENYVDAVIRVVRVLSDDLKKQARKQGLKDDDMVFVQRSTHNTYKLTKIEGSVMEFLRKDLAIKKAD